MTPAEFKEARQKLGLSARQMADALGLSDGAVIRKYERGAMNPSGPVQCLVAIFLRRPDILEWRLGSAVTAAKRRGRQRLAPPSCD